MKKKMMNCIVCGKETPRTARHQRYCQECRVTIASEQRREHNRRYRAKAKGAESRDEWLHTLDSSEMMAICLSCQRESERCSGNCKKIEEQRKVESLARKAAAHGV